LTITKSNIKGGFRGAGLAPFNPEVIISKLDMQLQTPTPIKEVAQQAQAWTSRTPVTVLKAGSQSEYLRGRIRRHHSSSPESILKALHSLTKAVTRNIQKTALLEAKNRKLRKVNDILSRRRRAKKTHLQNRGSLTIQEGQGLINQIDISTQVLAESSRSGGQGRSGQPRVRRYGTYGKTGHNARTCQEGIKASGNEYSS
jgi:hypothetical protein